MSKDRTPDAPASTATASEWAAPGQEAQATDSTLSLYGMTSHKFEVNRLVLADLLVAVAAKEHMALMGVTYGTTLEVQADRSVVHKPSGSRWRSPKAAALVEAAAVLRGDWREPAGRDELVVACESLIEIIKRVRDEGKSVLFGPDYEALEQAIEAVLHAKGGAA